MASLMEHTKLDINVLLEFKDVREAMARRFLKDKELLLSYEANIAMLLHDRYGITDYKERNQAAHDIMCLLFLS